MTPRTRRSIILISISLALATAAAVLANRWVNNRAAAVDATRPQQIGVVVAAADIPFGATIEARHLKKIEMVARERPPGSFTDPADVVGKVATAEILADEVLLERRFVTPGPGSPLAAVLAPEMRAVSVRVDDVVGVGGFILPGNRVDVIAARATGERAYAETILSNVKVLAVDQQASADKNAPVVVRAVTLEVTPDGAEELARAKQLGALQLSLRNPMDRSVHVADSGPGAIDSPIGVATAAPTPAAAAAPRSTASRIRRTPSGTDGISVIRGTEVTRSNDY
jgi:pilus assembly protein CpaB